MDKKNLKILLLVLFVLVLIEVTVVGLVLRAKKGQEKVIPQNVFLPQETANQGVMSFLQLTKPQAIGEALEMSVFGDTAGKTITGADIVIKFDPTILEVRSIIEEGPLSTFMVKDIKNDEGKIRISVYKNAEKGETGFNGKASLAKIIFAFKQAQPATLSFDFQGEGKTADSNLVEEGTAKDILGKVESINLTLSQ